MGDPPADDGYSDNPASDGFFDRWDREQERNALRLYQERAEQEAMRQHGLSACSTIWHNPAAAEACRQSHGGW